MTGSDRSGAYRGITNTDGTITWTAINNVPRFIAELGVDTQPVPSTLYGMDIYGSGYIAVTFRSADEGSTWTQLPDPGFVFDAQVPGGDFRVDTTTSPFSTVYVMDPSTGIFSTTNGGNSWNSVLANGGNNAGSPGTFGTMEIDSTTNPPTIYATRGTTSSGAYVAELNPSGTAFLFSTFLGGIDSQTGANAVALDASDNIYVTGSTSYPLFFPEVNAFEVPTRNMGNSAFFSVLGSQTLPTTSSGSITSQLAVQTGTLAITLPNITGSSSGASPTLSVTPLSSSQAANFSLSNNLGAYNISTTASYSGSITLCFQALTVNDPTTFNSLQLLHVVNGNLVNITSSRDFATRTVCGTTSSLSPFALVSGIPNVYWNTPSSIVYGTPLSSTQLNATAAVAGSFSYNPPLGSVIGPGTQLLSVTFRPSNTSIYSTVTKSVMMNVLYSTAACDGAPGHTILPPINADGSSVFKLGSTVPTKFRVCDVNGNSVGLPGTVASYKLIAKGATSGLSVDEQVYSTSADTAFHWDPTGQQWIFNQGTGKSNPTLSQSNTIYVFKITLHDGTYIQFQYGLK